MAWHGAGREVVVHTSRMAQLRGWLKGKFAERKTEPDSGLAKAFTYLAALWPFLKSPVGQQHGGKGTEGARFLSAPKPCAHQPSVSVQVTGRRGSEPRSSGDHAWSRNDAVPDGLRHFGSAHSSRA